MQPLRRVSSAAGLAVISPGEGWQPTPGMVVTPEHVQQLQATAGNAAVARLLAPAPAAPPGPLVVARQPSLSPTVPAEAAPAATFPWVGKIQAPYNAALRRDPRKDPAAPYGNIDTDLSKGTMLEVTGIEKGWLKVSVIDPGGTPTRTGYVSHELVRFVRDGPWEIEMPPDPVERLTFSISEAFLVLKRAEMKREGDPRSTPTEDEARRTEVATRTLENTKRYQVDRATFRVSFATTPGTKIKIATIEDFVLFAETVERQYPAATPIEVASEIRQVWFAGEKWATLLASRGIDGVNIESPADPIGAMFDMVDLRATGSQKVLKTRLGDVSIGHVISGIDATLSGMAEEPGRRHPKLRTGWNLANDVMHGDPRDFATWTGDIGQAYGEYIVEQYHEDAPRKPLKDYVADKASTAQLLGDIHGYIAAEVWHDTPVSIDPGGGTRTVSGILRTMYMVDKSSTPASRTYRAYLEKLSGAAGADLRAFAAQRSLGFARLWYVKALAFVRSGHYADQFDEHHEENERTAAAGDKLDSIIDSFMKMLVDTVR